jgi:hypothetical protein
MEMPVLSQDKAHHHKHATGTNPTSTDRKLRPPKADMEVLDVAEEASVVDLAVPVALATENGSTASTSQDHRTHV